MNRSRVSPLITHNPSFIIGAVLLALCTMPSALCSQGVGIGTTTPHPSAALDISSDTSGILIPRMTAAQRDAINSPEVGLMVFVTDDMRFYCYEGSDWEKVGGENTILVDADGDTKIQVEKFPDDDTIRFDIGGTERFRMVHDRLEFLNNTGSIHIGKDAGLADTSGLLQRYCIFIGNNAGKNQAGGDGFYYNIGIGQSALTNVTGGDLNTAVGGGALASITGGRYNTAIGYSALASNTSSENTAVGTSAMRYSSGTDNAALGYQALYNATGNNNVAVGHLALGNQNGMDGDKNVAIGSSALGKLDSGSDNVGIGYHSGQQGQTDLSRNVLIGSETMRSAGGAKHANIAIGYRSGYDSGGDSCVYLGYQSGYYNTSDHRLFIENSDADSANALIYGEFDNDLLRINGKLIATMGLNDADGDTKIQVEEGPDDDTIRFDMAGTEFFRMANGRLEVVNTGRSVFIGRNAGSSDDLTDNRNVAIGESALLSNINGTLNTAIGFRSLRSNTIGEKNTATGVDALYSNDTGGYNTASGFLALYSNNTGGYNTASGVAALYSNTDGVYNTASGYLALYSNTDGDYNTATGHRALYSNSLGAYNTAFGTGALEMHRINSYNTAIGYKAMHLDTSSYYNTAVGRQALYQNLNSVHNTAVGNLAMEQNISGSLNTGIGRRALHENTTGEYNTGLGNDALYSNQTGSRNVALGTEAGYSSTGDSSIFIGNKAGYFETEGDRLYIENSDADSANTLIYGEFDNDLVRINGTLEAKFGFTDSDHDTKIQLEESTDDDIIRFDMGGTEYFRMDSGRLEVVNTGGSVFIGRHVGMTDNFTDNVNVAIGDSALLSNNNGQRNTALGSETMYSNIGGNGNVAIGYQALRSSIYGGFNIASGNQAMFSNDSGNNNIASGFQALHNNISGSYNVALGSEAGFSSLGDGSVFIGNLAGYNETDGNRLYIENTDADSSSALIYGEFDNDVLALNAAVGIGTMPAGIGVALDVAGKVRMRTGAGAGKILVSSPQGIMTWTDPNALNKTILKDGDNDTQVQVEESPDEDVIRFDVGGTEYFRMGNGRLEVLNTGQSVFVGRGAGASDDLSNNFNVAIGDSALADNSTGLYNTASGYRSLHANTSGDKNTASGYQALQANTSGDGNTASGYQALYLLENTVYNTAVGQRALYFNTSGNYNTALGSEAGYNSTGDNNVFIGNKAGYSESGSDRLYIENSDVTADNALIYGEFDNNILAFNAQVGIGTSSPENDLHVIGDALFRDTLRATLNLQTDDNTKDVGLAFSRAAGNYEWNIFRDGASSDLVISGGPQVPDITDLVEYMRITDDGDVGIGTDAPNALLTVNGSATKPGGGTWGGFSDMRLKDVHGSFDYGLKEILQLQPVTYNYKTHNPLGLPSDKTYAGFVAQDVQKVIPEAIDSSGEYLTLHADPIYLAMLNSIKELKTENDALKAESAELKAELSQYQNEVETRLRALEKNNVVATTK